MDNTLHVSMDSMLRSDNRRILICAAATSSEIPRRLIALTRFRSLMLSCQRSPYLIIFNFVLRRRFTGCFILHLKSSFQMTVESNYVIAIATLSDWLKRLTPVFQPMRSKTKTNRTMYTSFFPSFERVTGNC